MTVPVVSTLETSASRMVAFVLPSKYTLDTLPQPNNAAVQLREVSGRKVAVRRFTWYATEKRIEAQKAVLEQKLRTDGMVTIGTAEVAQYNPPLSFPLTLRNEIMIPIE
jgi:phage major head subunit gpT-like protein